MLSMQRVNHAIRVGVALVENVRSHLGPPKPVLHYVIYGYPQLAVLLSYCQNLTLGFVPVLTLPETIGPFAEQGCGPGEVAILGNDLVKIRPVKEVVIDSVCNFRL